MARKKKSDMMRVPDEFKREIAEIADKNGVSMTQALRMLNKKLKKKKKEDDPLKISFNL